VSLQTDLNALGARLVPHSDNLKARVWGQLAKLGGVNDFRDRFWITLGRDICYPRRVSNPLAQVYETKVRHEMVHVAQQERDGLYWWLTKYLASQKFRWEQEREAYLCDIRAGENSPREVAELLRSAYKIYEPTVERMTAWFEAHR
jgi:hypothetical protein